ncbi:MAG TPA: DUF2158 domain-containing protein [Flavobacteriaceae bacterium]|nr:DUF2158 domain-containing protein [Flavobacteriaceae bacterium]
MGDWDYINDNMGGWNEDTGLPNFMDEPGFADDSYYDKEDDDDTNLEVEFEVGDIVKLNSCDVLMTIKNIDKNILTCRWFDKNDNIQNDKFNVAEISLVDKIENHQDSSGSKNSIPEINIDEDEIPF